MKLSKSLCSHRREGPGSPLSSPPSFTHTALLGAPRLSLALLRGVVALLPPAGRAYFLVSAGLFDNVQIGLKVESCSSKLLVTIQR